jgi:hypothetical protein
VVDETQVRLRLLVYTQLWKQIHAIPWHIAPLPEGVYGE